MITRIDGSTEANVKLKLNRRIGKMPLMERNEWKLLEPARTREHREKKAKRVTRWSVFWKLRYKV